MLQFIAFLEKIWENYGVFYVILIIVFLIVLWFIKKEITNMLERFHIAMEHLEKINSDIQLLNKQVGNIHESVEERCNLSYCPQFSDVKKQILQFQEDMKSFKKEVQYGLNTLTEYAKERMEIIAKDGKNTNEHLLGLIKTFIDRSINNK